MVKTSVSIGDTKFYGNNSYAHFYANGVTTITPASGVTITNISLTASSTSYNGFQSSGVITASVGTISGSTSSTSVTWSGSATSAFTISHNKQIRWTSIVVTYTAAAKTDPTITFNDGSVRVGKTLDLSTLFSSNSEGAVTYSITAGSSYASIDGSTLTGVAEGNVTVKAEQAANGSYNAGEATATITVNEALTLSSIAVTTAPTKTTYLEGESFDATGMVVKATYSDASQEDVTASCTFSPSTSTELTSSNTAITISYTENAVEKTTSQAITVKALQSIALSGTYTTTFTQNGTFNHDGAVVTATYDGGSTKTVTSDAEFSNPDLTTTGTKTVTVTYRGKTTTYDIEVEEVIDYVTLPFNWAGGSSSSLTGTTGVTASGLGSDYSSHSPYCVKLDNTGDYIQIKTRDRPEFVSVGVKMIGGVNTSKITVQESTDGETFTKVGDDLSISGSQNSTLTLTSTTAFASTTRYIRLLFTKGSNVGVGPISVTKYVPKYAFNFTATPTGGTVEVVDESSNDVTSGDKFPAETELTISATAATGYTFAGWSEANSKGTFEDAADELTTFTMPASEVTISASFTLNTHSLTANNGDHGTVAVTVNGEAWDGSSEIAYGSTVRVTATPGTNWGFSSWTATGVTLADNSANPAVFTMPDANVTLTPNYVDATVEYDVVVVDATGGTITATPTTATGGTTITLSYVLDSGYAFGEWVVEDEDENPITVTNNKFTMPAADVSVTATYVKIHTVTCYVAGEAQSPVERLNGATLNLDDPDAPVTGLQFVGWSSSSDLSALSYVANSSTVTSDLTLYAIFAAQSTTSYVKQTSGTVDGDYLIVYEGNATHDAVAFKGSLSSFDSANNGVAVTITNNTIASSASVDSETFTIDSTTGYIKGTSGKYIGQSSYANGLTTNDEGVANTFSFDEGNAVIGITLSGGTVTLRYNYASDQLRFRYFKSGQQAIALYKKTVSYSGYTLGLPVTVSVTSAKYATFSAAQPANFSGKGITVYKAKVDEEKNVVKLTEISDGIVPANTGVILYSNEVKNNVSIPVVACSTSLTDNDMVATVTRTLVQKTSGGKYNYILQAGPVFNMATTTGAYMPAGRAYLSTTVDASASGARLSVVFDDDQTTGISATLNDRSAEGRLQGKKEEMINDKFIYNLNGQRVENPKKGGIYIVNGKKVMMK